MTPEESEVLRQLNILAARKINASNRPHPDWCLCGVHIGRRVLAGYVSLSDENRTLHALKAALSLIRATPHLTPRSNGGVTIDWPNGELSFEPSGEQEFD